MTKREREGNRQTKNIAISLMNIVEEINEKRMNEYINETL